MLFKQENFLKRGSQTHPRSSLPYNSNNFSRSRRVVAPYLEGPADGLIAGTDSLVLRRQSMRLIATNSSL